MFLVIDIGGTKTLIAAFDKRGKKVKSFKFPTSKKQNSFLADLLQNLKDFQEFPVQKIVIALPGKISGTSFKLGNLSWENQKLSFFKPLKNLFEDTPITFMNDANLATYYEAHRYREKTVYLTFSTGIGGGIAKNGKLLPESTAFEPGHQKYTFNGQLLEWEDIASANAIGAAYGCQATDVKGKVAFMDIAERMSLGLVAIIKNIKPKVLIIGGPMGMTFPGFKKPLEKELKKYIPKLPKIVPPKHPTESVVYGGYLYAKKH